MSLTYQWTKGNTHTLLSVNLFDPFGNPISLTGVLTTDITLKMRRVAGATKYPFNNLTGTVTAITDATNGVFSFQFSSADVATAGTYEMGVSVNYGSTTLVPFLITFEILDA